MLIGSFKYMLYLFLSRFPKNSSLPDFKEATLHVLESLVDAFVVSVVADTKK